MFFYSVLFLIKDMRKKTVTKLIVQKYSRLEKFLIRSYLIDNEILKILITKKIKVE
jgi:hypothetical protein